MATNSTVIFLWISIGIMIRFFYHLRKKKAYGFWEEKNQFFFSFKVVMSWFSSGDLISTTLSTLSFGTVIEST